MAAGSRKCRKAKIFREAKPCVGKLCSKDDTPLNVSVGIEKRRLPPGVPDFDVSLKPGLIRFRFIFMDFRFDTDGCARIP
jgi:hypothetical protein